MPPSLFSLYKIATNWTYFSDRITTSGAFILNDLKNKKVIFNTITNISTELILLNTSSLPTVSVVSSDESIATISNIDITEESISFDVSSYETEGSTTITMTATDVNDETYIVTKTFELQVCEIILIPTYNVDTSVSTSYTFELNANDYYESTNKGINNSYALCKLNISAPLDSVLYLDCINSGESNYDYGILSNLDSTLTNNSSADSSYYKSFKGLSNENIQTVSYNIPAGEHYIYIKFIKDSSSNDGNDSLQFQVRFEE